MNQLIANVEQVLGKYGELATVEVDGVKTIQPNTQAKETLISWPVGTIDKFPDFPGVAAPEEPQQRGFAARTMAARVAVTEPEPVVEPTSEPVVEKEADKPAEEPKAEEPPPVVKKKPGPKPKEKPAEGA